MDPLLLGAGTVCSDGHNLVEFGFHVSPSSWATHQQVMWPPLGKWPCLSSAEGPAGQTSPPSNHSSPASSISQLGCFNGTTDQVACKQQKLISCPSGVYKSGIRGTPWSDSGEGPLPDCRLPASPPP